MTGDAPSRLRRLARRLFPREERTVGPPRTGTPPEEQRTFVIFLVTALGMSLGGVAYAIWAFG